MSAVISTSAVDLPTRPNSRIGLGTGLQLAPFVPIDASALASIKVPCALRRVPGGQFGSILPVPPDPFPGDVALARLEKIGKNARLELANGRTSTLHEGDVLAVVFGNRYATNQFEAYARSNGDACDLLSMGGLCGIVASRHDSVPEPTKLRLLGALGDVTGRPIRLGEYSLSPAPPLPRPPVTVVCGTTMDAGKTHTCMSVLLGLRRGKRRAAAVKLTGTACGRDAWKMHDAGASPTFDFLDGGLPSTFGCRLEQLLELYDLLLGHAAARGAEHVVIEIADGLLQQETAALLSHAPFREGVHRWVLAAGDSVAAVGGTALLKENGIRPLALSGLVTRSKLAMREAEAACGIRCFTAEQLQNGELNGELEAGLPCDRRAGPEVA